MLLDTRSELAALLISLPTIYSGMYDPFNFSLALLRWHQKRNIWGKRSDHLTDLMCLRGTWHRQHWLVLHFAKTIMCITKVAYFTYNWFVNTASLHSLWYANVYRMWYIALFCQHICLVCRNWSVQGCFTRPLL